MAENLLKINDDKTVALVLGSRNNQVKHHITVIKIGDCDITPSPTARNIGAVFDSEMSMVGHVKYTCRIAYFHLRNIASIRSCLTKKGAVHLIYSLVISRIDYANCLLHGIPDCLINKLQSTKCRCSAGGLLPQMGPHHTGAQETALASREATPSLCNSSTGVSCSTRTGTRLHN